MIDKLVIADQDLEWTSLIGADEKPLGEIGVLAESVTGRLRFMDGHRISYASLPVNFRGTQLMIPAVVFSIPDYPAEDAATYVAASPDARQFARALLAACDSIDRACKREIKHIEQTMRSAEGQARRAEIVKLTECTINTCHRQRQFFDEQGNGYCKRHADERGIRPKGKIA